jgi:hypothetical protein
MSALIEGDAIFSFLYTEAEMSIALIVLIIFAVVAAIDAFLKVRDQYRPQFQPVNLPEKSSVEEEVDQGKSESVPSIHSEFLDVPLATSITVSEIVNPTESLSEVLTNLKTENLPEIDLPDVVSEHEHHHHADIFEEIERLEHGDQHQQLERLAQYVNEHDSVKRVAAASAVGAIARQVQGVNREQAIQLLNEFAHDVDPQVRVQAAACLGEIA